MTKQARWMVVDYGFRHLHTAADEPAQLTELAATLGYSRYHLSRVIHQETGLSLRSYLNRLRMLRARRLLATTDQSITDIALSVGYSSLGTFCRYFRALVGLSPTQFRAHLIGRPQPVPLHPYRTTLDGIITAATHFTGRIHVGLFPTREPNGLPVAQTVATQPGAFAIRHVPPGTHYVIAIATCCYRAYPGDLSGAWAWGVSAHPVTVDSDTPHVSGISLPLIDRLPTTAPILATFAPLHDSNCGEALSGSSAVTCGLKPLTQGAEQSGRAKEGSRAPVISGAASVLVYVSDMSKAAEFYGRLLGTAPTHRDPTTTTYDLGTTRLILHRDKLPSRAAARGAMEFNLEVPDAQAFSAHLGRNGIAASPPMRMPWGWVVVTVQDPDGNEIECYEIPSET